MNGGQGEVDLYEILQVHERAIPEIVEKAYRTLVRKYHPDVHPPEKRGWANAKMSELNIAYDVLSDPAERAEYDAGRRLGRSRSPLDDDGVVRDHTVKCFNHPKRPSVKFCWHCGRPICVECFGGESHGHTICVPCQVLVDRDRDWRVGEAVTERERSRTGPAMGSLGVIVHYAVLALLYGAVIWAVYTIALAFGNTPEQAGLLALGLTVVFLVLVVQRLTWRVICPECSSSTGHAGFRAGAPWREFLAPQPVCPRCAHRFRYSELNQPFD